MKVIVTGSKGRTGVSVVREFQAAGHDTVGVDIKPCGSGERNYKVIDLTDGAAVYDALAGADAVVHFGSFAGDRSHSWEQVYRNIVLGGFHVLQACANLGIKRIALASSPAVYGRHLPPAYVPIDEDHPKVPASIYGAAKENLESLSSHYSRWKGLAIAAFRPCRIVYEGSFDWRFRRFTESDEAAADALWAYSDARDVASACRLWIESDIEGFDVFNVAADDVCVETPTKDLVARFLPPETEVRVPLEGRMGLISCEKAKKLLNWRPRYSWRDLKREADEKKAKGTT